MKKYILISIFIGILITGCAEKEQLATSVLELAGNKAVVGWDNNISNNNEKIKTKIIYKYKTFVTS